MPRWTADQLKDYEHRMSASRRNRKCSGDEKQQDAVPGQADNKPKAPEMDGSVYPKFRVSIALMFSDNRKRDMDGAATTLLDCITHTVRRLLAGDTGTGGDSKKGS